MPTVPHAVCVAALIPVAWTAAEPLVLQNRALRLEFRSDPLALTAVRNRLTGEVYTVEGDQFAIELGSGTIEQAYARRASLSADRTSVRARYEADGVRIDLSYTLGPANHFVEKRLALTFTRDDTLRQVTVSRPAFAAPGLELVRYRYPQFGRVPGAEPCSTFFGRTGRGSLFAGLAMPFDRSTGGGNAIELAYLPSVKVSAGQTVPCEAMYLGVCARSEADTRPLPPPIRCSPSDPGAPVELREAEPGIVPLASESAAMVAMTESWLGPPRHGFVPMACGWHSEMQQGPYASDEDVEADMRSLEFLADCGIDWFSESHPWGGETERMNALGPDDHYTPGPRARRLLEHARDLGMGAVMWSSMTNTHHWSPLGRPFRADQPDWLLTPGPVSRAIWIIAPAKGNCVANRPFFEWLSRINREGFSTGLYRGWAMDGSFFGDGGWYSSIVPVDCMSATHDHLPGDANWASQNALDRLFADVRAQRPDTLIFTCRPAQDLGVFSLRNVDVCFTLLETGTGASNLQAGDEIRRWSRYRVHHHFVPHYIDQPLLFPSRADRTTPLVWSSEHLDYILLSAISSSPNLLFYMPTKSGIPDRDKATIRRWLDWARAQEELLKVRRDLPEWPEPDRVDGSAHIVGDRGLVFLFNPGDQPREAEFALTEEGTGWRKRGRCRISQAHPAGGPRQVARHGDTVRWVVPPASAVVLTVAAER